MFSVRIGGILPWLHQYLNYLNHIDNLKYNDNYSANNDIRVAFPLPLRDVLQNDFPTRTHRSAKNDTTSIIDNYRIFLANQFKDLPKNRGELWKLSSFNNLLYFHMQESLFVGSIRSKLVGKPAGTCGELRGNLRGNLRGSRLALHLPDCAIN